MAQGAGSSASNEKQQLSSPMAISAKIRFKSISPFLQ
jgi:hypothetical protein